MQIEYTNHGNQSVLGTFAVKAESEIERSLLKVLFTIANGEKMVPAMTGIMLEEGEVAGFTVGFVRPPQAAPVQNQTQAEQLSELTSIAASSRHKDDSTQQELLIAQQKQGNRGEHP